ncbi:Uncharacterized protein dnm_085150 [Desulfonema magnum]|uniref:Cytochrome C n=1 Tax=Desulfonema magnum TaxID=45655 RepID=A0A975BV80_9BACT|nr:Uncharacterized protein dnm_085150 [Desulfonema magnum]
MSRIKAHLFVFATIFLVVFVCFICLVKNVYSLKNVNGCIECHTDEKKIRSLYMPPKINFKAEEGEG